MNSAAAWLRRLRPDTYLVLMVVTVALASFWPVRGSAEAVFGLATKLAVSLVFFLQGSRLAREAVIAGLVHWRLHLVVLVATYGMFPLLCLGLAALPAGVTPSALGAGLIFLGCLPSTIQSSIGFTAIARGNVPAAVAAASASNLLGVFLTPALAGLMLHAQGEVSSGAMQAIVVQLLLPFLAGQLCRPWIGDRLRDRAEWLGRIDRGAILLVVYGAFSGAVVSGVWEKLDGVDLVRLLLLCLALLAVVLAATRFAARRLGFSSPDEIAVLFCGSTKSLASGAPMASMLFSPAAAGVALLPLMVFHQLQLMACAMIAAAYAKRRDSSGETV